jgi:hypothetical protein
MFKIALVALMLSTTVAYANEKYPVSDMATGHFYACDEKGFCEDVEQNFVSMSGCQVGMMPYMAFWIGSPAGQGFHLKDGRFQCHPIEQTRI